MATIAEDKPFKCSKCSQCFANSDRLNAHKKVHSNIPPNLKVKIPGISSENATDQTPTPTRFLKTADVDGTQLFEEINPFDQDFRLASKRQISTISSTSTDESPVSIAALKKEVEPEITSSTLPQKAITLGFKPQTPNSTIDEGVVKPRIYIQEKVIAQQSVSSTTNHPVLTNQNNNNNSTTIKIQDLLQHIKLPIPQAVATPPPIVTPQSTLPTLQTPVKDSNIQQNIKEQLQLLINSGQIKFQFSTIPSSPNVQATVVGTVAKSNNSTEVVSSAPEIKHQQIQPFNKLRELLVPNETIRGVVPTPMSIVSDVLPKQSNMVQISSHPGTNLAVAKQKLKEVIIQQGNGIDNNNVIAVAPRIPMSNQSNQGKYKDIILTDDLQNNMKMEMGDPKRKRSLEDSTPDEKRKKFLERNRAAASRCRLKRKIWVNQLEKKSDDLQETNNQLMNEITSLRAEVAQLKALLIAHKDCPVTLQQKALFGQISSSSAGAYVTLSDGQIIAIQEVPAAASNGIHPTAAEEVATSALTDMADRATLELASGKSTDGTITVIQAPDGSMSVTRN